MLPVFYLVEIATRGANKDVFGMPCVSGDKIAGEKIYTAFAVLAGLGLDPKEVLNVRIR
jgi:hypothetical protein